MRFKLPICMLLFLTRFQAAEAGTYHTIASGAWTNTAIWSLTENGPSCNCVPQGSDNVNIRHTVSLDRRLTNGNTSLGGVSGSLYIYSTGYLNGGIDFNMDILSQGSLTVCGRLVVKNLEFFNGSTFYFCTGSNIQVNGNFINRNNSPNIVVDGTVTVSGTFENGTGAVITGNGGFVVTNGTAVNYGSLFSCIGQYPCTSYPCIISSMCGTSTVLPVEWMSFEIISGSSGRELHWATATEENSDFFEVQVSENGVDFEPIGRLDAAGNSSNTRNYSFLHAEKLFEDAYYRIREVDFDGKSSLSEIRFVQAVKTGGMLVFPNPVKSDVVRMSVAGTAGTVCKVMLLDATGRKVFDNSLELKEHHSTDLNFELPPGIESGCYSLLAIVGSEIWSERLMIQR